MELQQENIVAVASGQGRAGIAVIRVSGPTAWEVVARGVESLPPARIAGLRTLRNTDGEVLDRAVILCFAEGASFTGEAVVEIHCHGGLAVQSALMGWLLTTPRTRMAEPGEFTRRALLAGRMSLAEVEALGDLLAAETEAQRRQAQNTLSGALHDVADGWRRDLVRALSLLEVTIDWADEEVPEDVAPEVASLLSSVLGSVRDQIARSEATERLRVGFNVALIGAPNAGKSTLLNALAGREAAITSPIPGTTRDAIELRYDLDGLPVTFVDTAGLRETEDRVEQLGIDRTRQRAEQASLRLFLTSTDVEATGDDLWQPGDLRVWTKADLGPGLGDVVVSAKTGDGMSILLAAIAERLVGQAGEAGLVGRLRQRLALEAAERHLAQAESALEIGAEIAAAEIRTALRALEELVGRVGVEDVLDSVFSQFCLGK